MNASLPCSPFFPPNFIPAPPFLGCPNGPIGYLLKPRLDRMVLSGSKNTERSLDLHSEGSDPRSLCCDLKLQLSTEQRSMHGST